jgi:hypothetical protein
VAKDKDGKEITVIVEPVTSQDDKTVDGKPEDIMIPKSRLDEVLEKNRVLLEKQTKRDESDAKKQKAIDEEAGNFKKLADEADQRAKDAETRLQEATRYNVFLMEASKVGINDPAVAYMALPVAKEGEKMDELVATLIEEKPYFVVQVQTKNGVPIIISGGGKPPLKPNQKAVLQAAYAEAMKRNDVTGAIAIKRQIAELVVKT